MTAVGQSATPVDDHPAKWSGSVLAALDRVVHDEHLRLATTHEILAVLDPFAGVGAARLQGSLGNALVTGVELQPEWAATNALTIVGDAAALPDDWTGTFDAVVTSPSFSNRMADHHDAKDACRAEGCNDGKVERRATPVEVDNGCELGVAFDPCPVCKGTGLSWRNTYGHTLARAGAALVEGSGAGLQWGNAYRQLHARALGEMIRCVTTDGLLAINMSNHIREGVEQHVVEWWITALIGRGCRIHEVVRVLTPRQRRGANGEARVDGEVVIVGRTPVERRLL